MAPTEEDVLEAIRARDEYVVTAIDLLDDLAMSHSTVLKRLDLLMERGDVRGRKVGAKARIFWLPADEDGTDRERERLEAAARELWDDHWTLHELGWADGSTDRYAFRSLGAVDPEDVDVELPEGEGSIVEQERLKFDDDGELNRYRVAIRQEQCVGVLEDPGTVPA